MSQRFRRLTDLFVVGKAVALPDGSHLWLQAINSYERDECLSDAQVARARLILALKENGTERIKIEGRLSERGRDALVNDLVEAKADAKFPELVAAIEDDPDWVERVAIMRRTNFAEAAKPAEQAERDVVDKIFTDWAAAVQGAVDGEREYLRSRFERADDAEVLDTYLEMWLERRGGDIAAAEYALTELWYATRYCEAVPDQSGELDHTRCAGHQSRVFETKAEARSAPDALVQLLSGPLAELAMGGRDPKDSASPTSSSDSSPTPNAVEESTPSTSGGIPAEHPGTSPQPSVTH